MISLCMIVKNEEDNLKKCLDAISKYEFEIVIVDTGSTDNTVEIARSYTDKVYHYKWCNDFSSARNYSIEQATNDYVLVLDADEIVQNINMKELLRSLDRNKVGRLERHNIYIRNGEKNNYRERVNRLFDKRYYHYEGRIHEQIVAYDKHNYDTYNIPVLINHIGYEDGEIVRKDKITRNIDLLLEELNVNGDDPYILFQLGKSFYMKEDYEEAIRYFEKAMDYDLDTRLEYVIDMVETYGYALINSQQYDKALNLLGIYDEFSGSADFVFLMGLIYMNNARFEEAVREFEKATTFKYSSMEGVNDYLAYYNIGVIYECLGNKNKALEYYRKSNKYDKSRRRIEEINK